MAEASESARAVLDRPLAFMHVPKASGIAITTGIREVLPAIPYVGFFDLSHFGTFREFNAALSSNTHADGLPPALGVDFVGGHFAYSTIIKGRPNARLLTVLREPRSRILSLWMYWRSIPDDTLESWGAWSNRVRLAWQPLAGFVGQPEVACQTDNVVVRMLLWPHSLIPDDGFIDESADHRLLDEAAARLRTFDFTDLIENSRFEERLQRFLGKPFVYGRANETQAPRAELKVPLELAGPTTRLLEHRSRLDRRLWLAVATARMPGVDAQTLSDQVFARAVARYSEMAAG